jgi:hypothetical protein
VVALLQEDAAPAPGRPRSSRATKTSKRIRG